MTSSGERWNRAQQLFFEALERRPDEQRAFLDQAAGEPGLADEVWSLLGADAGAGEFIEQAVGAESERWRAEATVPESIAGYRITGRLGEGGFGVVWSGVDDDGRRVAIKTCPSSDRRLARRFVREARIASRLVHPRIVAVHDYGEDDGTPYLVQELLPGRDLAALIGDDREVALRDAVRILRETAEGLELAHREGVLHRDVTPNNIRVLPSGSIKLMDFGIAKLVQGDSLVTATGVTLGTIGYLAPEQIFHEELGPYTDVFAFGVLAYELLTGERPFRGKTIGEVSRALLHESPEPLREVRPEVPSRLEDLVHGCLEKRPNRRPSGFAVVKSRLESLEAQFERATFRPSDRVDLRLVIGLCVLALAVLSLVVLSI